MSAKWKLKKNRPSSLNTLNILSGSFIIYSLKRAISGLIFILLLVFYHSTKITLGVLLALLYKRAVSIDRRKFLAYFIKALRLPQLRVKLISRVVKESSNTLFPGERRLISLQYWEMLSISLRFHCLSPDMFCTVFSHAKPPQNIHAAREVTLFRF